MKNLKGTIVLALISLSINGFGQTIEHKNNFSIGGGKEGYNGDLGNAWFKMDEEWYGFIVFNYNSYVNKSFDLSLSLTHGNYGHCREEDEEQFRADGTEVLNMLSRLTSLVVTARYKFTNGYMLKENARLSPYLFLGAGVNNISNHWWKDKNRVNTGNYGSLNGGLGLHYNFLQKLTLTYQLGFGYLTSDEVDFRSEGKNDMFMQHALMLGINF